MTEEKRKVLCDVYSRIVGYLRPVINWNVGKKQEFEDRVPYSLGIDQEDEKTELE